jgi:hypothetical protein
VICLNVGGTHDAKGRDMTTHETTSRDVYRQRVRIGLGILLAIAVFFLWEEHRAHLLGVLPWLLLLACPLMHLFMHRGHRSHHTEEAPSSGEKQEQAHDEHSGHRCC